MKRTILNLFRNKLNKTRSIGITSYDYPTSRIINNCNVDFIVVGDTVGSTVHGIKNLNEVPMSMMLTQFVKVGMDAVKVEGYFPDRIKSIVDSGTVVMGHLGLTPQTQARLGGYRIQAKTHDEVEKLVGQAKDVEESGASLLLLEAVPKEVSKIVRDELKIPVYGIGAGPCVDGQLVISHDILGLFWDFKPKFIKQYINGEPDDEHSYNMKQEELDKLLGMSGSSWKYD
jgi:3-methyl-2-oxobutanoate hydroxymethyltransferase